jgi:PadR family transcriptional regulator PadR
MVVIRETAISQLRRGALEFCVLALLSDGERYSFEIGTLYPLLSRLRKEGSVETTWRESVAGPPRRYYRLTPTGRALLQAFASEWVRFRDSVDTLLATGAQK